METTPTLASVNSPATPVPIKKRKDLTLLEKVEALNIISQSGKSHRDVAKMFGVGRSQISSLVKRRDEVFARVKSNDVSVHRKRIPSSTGKHCEINDHVYMWYKEVRSTGKAVTGPELQKKALEVSRNLFGNEEFKASNGWLGSFQKRHNILFGKNALDISKQENLNSDSNDSSPSAGGSMYIHDQDAMEMHMYENYMDDGTINKNSESFSTLDKNDSSMMHVKTEPNDFEYYFETLPVNRQKNLNSLPEPVTCTASRTCTCTCKDHNSIEERNDTFRMKYLNHLKSLLKNSIDNLEDLGAEVVAWIVLPTEDNCSQIFHLGTNKGVEFINTKPTIDAELHSFLKNSGTNCSHQEKLYTGISRDSERLDNTPDMRSDAEGVREEFGEGDLRSQIEGTREELVDRCIQIIDRAYRSTVSKEHMFPYQLLKVRQKAWFTLSGFPEELLPLKHPLEYETSGLKKIILAQDKIKFHILHKKLQEAYYKKPPCTSTVKSSLLHKIKPSVNNMEVVSNVLRLINSEKDNPHEHRERDCSTVVNAYQNKSRSDVLDNSIAMNGKSSDRDGQNRLNLNSNVQNHEKDNLDAGHSTNCTISDVSMSKSSSGIVEDSSGALFDSDSLSVTIKEEPVDECDDTDQTNAKREASDDDPVCVDENPFKKQKLTFVRGSSSETET